MPLRSLCLVAAFAAAALPALAADPQAKPSAAPPAGGAAPTTPPTPTSAKPAGPPTPAPAITFSEGLATPESVLYDAATDTYLVSNINGSPLAKDNNGYITELSPDGKVVAAKLVEGGRAGVTLHAPKGLALVAATLYVADIDTVRLFDRKTGAPKGEVKVLGATFVNDLAAGHDGKVYVTDTGMRAGKDGLEPTGSDGLYVIEPGKKPTLKTLVKSKDLHQPNGVLASKDGLAVVTFGAAELQSFDLAGKKTGATVTLPKGGLDGVVACGTDIVVSSWEGKALYRGKPAGPFAELVSGLEAPADLGCDTKRARVLVPRFLGHTVEVYELK